MSRFHNRQAKAQWPPRDPTLADCIDQLTNHGARLHRFTLTDRDEWQLRDRWNRLWRRPLPEAVAVLLTEQPGMVEASTELGAEYHHRQAQQLVG